MDNQPPAGLTKARPSSSEVRRPRSAFHETWPIWLLVTIVAVVVMLGTQHTASACHSSAASALSQTACRKILTINHIASLGTLIGAMLSWIAFVLR